MNSSCGVEVHHCQEETVKLNRAGLLDVAMDTCGGLMHSDGGKSINLTSAVGERRIRQREKMNR